MITPNRSKTSSDQSESDVPTICAWRIRSSFSKKWMAANGSVVDEMERRAVEIDDSGRRVSARYLIERQRYEGASSIVPVSFVDDYGNEHLYSFPTDSRRCSPDG